MAVNDVLDLPPGLDPELLYTSTGEDKGDDVNFAIGVHGAAPPPRQAEAYRALEAWLTAERCAALLGCPCRVVPFPRLRAVNVLAVGLLRTAGFDKQGKGTGRALLETLRRATREMQNAKCKMQNDAQAQVEAGTGSDPE
jgi:hypothetical protein